MEAHRNAAGELVARLCALVDAVGEVEPDELDADEAARMLLALTRQHDRLAGMIARFARAVADGEAWRDSGAASMAAWWSLRSGVGRGRARAAVELGSAMAAVPALDDAVGSGEVSPAAAAAVIPALDDPGFLDVAGRLIEEIKGSTAATARRHVEAWRAVADPADDSTRRQTARDGRALAFRPLGDGMTHVEGTIPDETARTLRQALAHLAEQQRLDGTGRTRDQRRVDALGELAAAYCRGEVTGGRNLPRIIVTMTLDDLEARRPGRDTFSRELLTPAEIERLCCDSTIHRLVADQRHARMYFGRGRRSATPNQWLAMVARDGGCRHPACDRPPQWCEAHHLRGFAARGGLTDIDEMVLLCHHHHHALHDGGWVLSGEPDHLIFTGPDGRKLHSRLPTIAPPTRRDERPRPTADADGRTAVLSRS